MRDDDVASGKVKLVVTLVITRVSEEYTCCGARRKLMRCYGAVLGKHKQPNTLRWWYSGRNRIDAHRECWTGWIERGVG